MKKDNSLFFLTIIGGAILAVIMLSIYYSIPIQIVSIFATISSLIFGAMIIWNKANARATGEEWWQDDHCSGWRGY